MALHSSAPHRYPSRQWEFPTAKAFPPDRMAGDAVSHGGQQLAFLNKDTG